MEIRVDSRAFLTKYDLAAATAMAAMTNALRAIDDGSFLARADDRREGDVVIRIHVDQLAMVSTAAERLISSCVSTLVSDFVTLLDRLIALQRLMSKPFTFSRAVQGATEIVAYVREELEKAYLTVAADHSLQNRQKLRELGIAGDSERVALSMFALRRALEHHGGVATEHLTVILRHPGLVHDGQAVQQFPHAMQGGSTFSVQFIETTKSFKSGDPIRLSEADAALIHGTLGFLAQAVHDFVSARLAKEGA